MTKSKSIKSRSRRKATATWDDVSYHGDILNLGEKPESNDKQRCFVTKRGETVCIPIKPAKKGK